MTGRKAPAMVWVTWWGGSSYSAPCVDDHTEEVAHADIVSVMLDRLYNRDGSTPAVDESSEAHVYYADPRGNPDPYPDEIVRFSRYHNTYRREAC